MRIQLRHGRRHGCALAIIFCLVSIAPAWAKKSIKPSPEGQEAKSLAETVAGTEKVDGLLTFYRSPAKLLLELPRDLEGAPLGFAAVMVHAAGDFRARGGELDSQLVRWQRRGDHLVLVKQNLDFRSADNATLAPALAASFSDSPAFASPLLQVTGDPSPLLVDAAKLFGPDLAQLLPRNSGFTVRAEDAVLLSLRAFPDNVVARVAYRARRDESAERGGSRPEDTFARFRLPGRLPDPRWAELIVDYNFYRLPEDGFRPRRVDERIGAMSFEYKDYSDVDSADTLFRHVARRWDVRKADPTAPISDPVAPITFYMDRSIPERWRPLVREGALWWNRSFEKIGIRDVVRVLDPPLEGDWDPADLRHSVIYWNLSDNLVFSGLAGPTLADPRTGQIIKASVHLNGEFFSYALNRYLVYAWWRAPDPGAAGESAADRASLRDARRERGACDRSASFSSQLAFARLVLAARGEARMGSAEAERFSREAFLELVAHEVGHALGFPHNWKASLVSRWDDVRSGRVDGRQGPRIFSASVMDYNPIYLAPRGSVQGDFVLREVGPYDDLAVEYLYRPFDGLSPAVEAAALDAIAARAETEPGLIYDGGELGDIDPTTSSDDYGDDSLAFAESRLVLLEQEVLPRLPELVLAEGHDYNLLRQALDSAIFSVAMDYIDMTARHVGGQVLLRRVAGSPGSSGGGPPPITPIPAARQRRALEVLDRYVFADSAFVLAPETLALFKADLLEDWNYPWRYASDYNVGQRIAGLYDSALSALLAPARLARILDNERRTAAGADRFTLPELFEHLERTAYSSLTGVSADRRALQRLVAGRLGTLVLNPPPGTPAEASQLAAASLRSIRGRVDAALVRKSTLDGYTRAHLEDLSARATRVLAAQVQLQPGG